MRSMTGYGHWTYRNGSFAIEASAKSYNNRYLDISCYLSPALQAFESHIDEVKEIVSEGTKKANAIGNENIAKIKEKMHVVM